MEKSWFNFIFSQGEFEYIGELSKATDSFAPFEIYNDLSDLEFGFYSYCRSSYLYNGSKSDNDPYIKDTKSNFNNYLDNYINSCMDSYFRSHIGIDSHFLGDIYNSGHAELELVEIKKRWGGVDVRKLWVLCEGCDQSIYRKFNKMYICEECGNYLKISSKERIELLIDPGTWDPMDEDMVSLDPIEWDWENETSTFNFHDQYRLKDHLRYLKKESEKLSRAAKRKLLDRDRELRRKLLESQKELEENSQVDSQEENSQVDSQEETSQVDSQEETSQVDLKRWQEQMDNFAREARRKLLESLEELEENSQVDSQEENSQVDSQEENSQVDSQEETSQVDSQEETSQVDSQEETSQVDLKRWKEQIDELSRAARRKLLEWQEETSPFDSDSEEETSPFDSDSEEETSPFDSDSEEEEEEETSLVDLKSVREELDNLVRAVRRKILELQKELEENSQVDSQEETCQVDSEEGTCQVDSEEGTCQVDSQKGFSEVDLKRWLEQLDEMSREGTSQVDSEEGTSQVDSEEGTSQVDSEEGTSQVDSDSEEEEEYQERLYDDQKTTGLTEAIQTGTGKLNGIPVAIGVMDFEVIGGSMGSVVGEKITRLIEYATNQRLPLILVCSSGGARMQEGSLSLMQMAKISSALYDYQLRKGLFYISILASPTTGGVTASFGMLGDIVIAEPYAYIAFAGKRVIEETLKIEVPEGSQVAELLFDTGLLDAIVPRNILKGVLSELFQLHAFFPLNKN
uniref:Acetyl-coenzyme A carboxylase carboxyl transferase subunit beta, chloroplastic n=1 Tax=Parrya pinnatifida TaxID=744010 RepID=A0A6M8Z982_9BRAS|nr:carboxytransferase beta subunit [Parrya pinnatifida]